MGRHLLRGGGHRRPGRVRWRGLRSGSRQGWLSQPRPRWRKLAATDAPKVGDGKAELHRNRTHGGRTHGGNANWAKRCSGHTRASTQKSPYKAGPGEADLAPGLYVTATPIGNARRYHAKSSRSVAELRRHRGRRHPRHSQASMAIHGIAKPLQLYNDHNGARERPA